MGMLKALCFALLCGAVATGARAADFRIQANAGYAFSALKEDVSEPLGGTSLNLVLEEIDSGSGIGAGAGFWVDGWLGENVSVGVDYIYTGLRPTTTLRLDVVNQSRRFDVKADVDLHSFFLNAAWRHQQGAWHPYVGGGVGFGFIDIEFDGGLGNLDGAHGGYRHSLGSITT